MSYLLAYRSVDGPEVVVELEEAPTGIERVAATGEIAARAKQTLEEALSSVKAFAEVVVKTVDSLARKPEEAGVEFGVKLGAKAGAIIVSTDTEAHLKVSLKWVSKRTPA